MIQVWHTTKEVPEAYKNEKKELAYSLQSMHRKQGKGMLAS
jgi:hypothetical protein